MKRTTSTVRITNPVTNQGTTCPLTNPANTRYKGPGMGVIVAMALKAVPRRKMPEGLKIAKPVDVIAGIPASLIYS